jgi:hypothetical protein
MKDATIAGAMALVLTVLGAAGPAGADEFEASLHLQPVGGLARLAEDGADAAVSVPVVGGAVRFTYGLSNQLALDSELGFASAGAAQYDDVTANVGGTTTGGLTLDRTTRLARLTTGATWRFGVAVIPTLHLGAGLGARLRGDAAYRLPQTGTTVIADDDPSGLSFDLLVTARLGLDVRLGARWLVGAAAGVTHAVPLGAPAMDLAEVHLHAAYYWYPLW